MTEQTSFPSKVWRFVRRHKIWAVRTVRRKLEEWEQELVEEADRQASAHSHATRDLRREVHFGNNRYVCDVTLVSFIPMVRESVERYVNVSALTSEFRNAKNVSRAVKMQVWEALKVTSFSRTFTSLYELILLGLLQRVQLNIIARLAFDSETVQPTSGATRSPVSQPQRPGALGAGGQKLALSFDSSDDDDDVRRRFLALVQYLLDYGIILLVGDVHRSTTSVLASYGPSSTLSLGELRKIVRRMRDGVELQSVSGFPSGSASLSDPFLTPAPPTNTGTVPTTRQRVQQGVGVGMSVSGGENEGAFVRNASGLPASRHRELTSGLSDVDGDDYAGPIHVSPDGDVVHDAERDSKDDAPDAAEESSSAVEHRWTSASSVAETETSTVAGASAAGVGESHQLPTSAPSLSRMLPDPLFARYLLPAGDFNTLGDERLQRLLTETRVHLLSADFDATARSALDACFSTLEGDLAGRWAAQFGGDGGGGEGGDQNISSDHTGRDEPSTRQPISRVMAFMSGMFDVILNPTQGSEGTERSKTHALRPSTAAGGVGYQYDAGPLPDHAAPSQSGSTTWAESTQTVSTLQQQHLDLLSTHSATPNPYVRALSQAPVVDRFSAIVYRTPFKS